MQSRVKIKSLLRYLLIGSTTVLLIVISAYTINFFQSDLSDSPANWGAFGDYFGGIINPIFGFLNLILLIYIAHLVDTAEEGRFRSKFIKEVYDKLTNEINSYNPKEWDIDRGEELYYFLHKFNRDNKYIFIQYEDDFDELCNDLQSEIISLKVAQKSSKEYNDTVNQMELRKKYLTQNLSNEEEFAIEYYLIRITAFEIQSTKLLKFIRMIIINKSIGDLLKSDTESTAKEGEKELNQIIKRQIEKGII